MSILNRHPLPFFEYYVKVVKKLLSLLLVLQSPYWFSKIHILHIFGIFLAYLWYIFICLEYFKNILHIFGIVCISLEYSEYCAYWEYYKKIFAV